jgi:hypothetical protein
MLPTFSDWRDYADLALYGALEAYNRGDSAQAYERYEHTMTLFSGVGFDDKAYKRSQPKRYTTYKLALALYVGAVLDQPTNDKLLTALLAKQDKETGGFTTLYDSRGVRAGDTNTETTAYALLALATIQTKHTRD